MREICENPGEFMAKIHTEHTKNPEQKILEINFLSK